MQEIDSVRKEVLLLYLQGPRKDKVISLDRFNYKASRHGARVLRGIKQDTDRLVLHD